ncbi:MAG: transglutaminase-like domain-containing protein [Candidatus Omnitrophota bacterium]
MPPRIIFNLVIFILLAGCAPHYSSPYHQPQAVIGQINAIVDALPREYQLDVELALHRAKKNAGELVKALSYFDGERREAMAFLVRYMPARDLETLSSEFLINNVRLAYQSRDEVPWGKDIPKDVFLNYVLPYVNVNERRDNWRGDFTARFLPLAKEQGSINKAAVYLNTKAFEVLGVEYHATKRHKPDQSPYESITLGYASCTGLSILAADVLRSAGIPVRIAGIPIWADKSGNHTWIEVWDHGQWYHLGAAEAGGYNEAWFNEKAAHTDPSHPAHRIYAVSFRRTAVLYPAVWNLQVDDIYAEDVTARYLELPSK